jgi:uncharacterized protein (DUF2141 family)
VSVRPEFSGPRHVAGNRLRLAVARPQKTLLVGLVMSTALLVPAPSSADPPATGVLTIHIASLRSNNGQVGCMMYNSAKGYPTDASFSLQHLWCPVADAASSCTFAPVPAGIYAVACFHDENKNGKLDTGMFGIPTEGTVASNHAKGFMGPPSFDKARFSFTGAASQLELRMGY